MTPSEHTLHSHWMTFQTIKNRPSMPHREGTDRLERIWCESGSGSSEFTGVCKWEPRPVSAFSLSRFQPQLLDLLIHGPLHQSLLYPRYRGL
ncbi:hypothetical protein LOC498154, isoform CRA_d [Rattus norvegicus]|uniref:Uncharacterized protein LOC498154 n=1 Tax=Rattus norvegicus TaxID=10116 RepID=A6K1W0_RAT|nr:hypothetical protein LOC498154, isoform CRA_d [Rattus norvegicus]